MALKIRVGGVPEHFNLPWLLAMEQGDFLAQDIQLEWTNYSGGTGEMSEALDQGRVDVCVMLTEGAIAHIASQNSCKIISKYINSPLIWGIYTGVENTLSHPEDMYTRNYAISRFGSGSHIMATIDAYNQGHVIRQDQFKMVKNLVGALESLTALDTDVFYWEKFTTKPYVDQKILKKIGEYVTPWPCFVIVAPNAFIRKHAEGLKRMLTVIHRRAYDFMHAPHSVDQVSACYHLEKSDVKEWFYATEWSTTPYFGEKTIKNVLFSLDKVGIINNQQMHPKEYYYTALF